MSVEILDLTIRELYGRYVLQERKAETNSNKKMFKVVPENQSKNLTGPIIHTGHGHGEKKKLILTVKRIA